MPLPLAAADEDPASSLAVPLRSQQQTARRARDFLQSLSPMFKVLTATQKRVLVVALARRGLILYGNAFDIVKVSGENPVDFDSEPSVIDALDRITVCEIKSTDRGNVGHDFGGYFFALSTAELLTAQSLGPKFTFLFVSIQARSYQEMTLGQVFAKAKGIYPSWSIRF